jgi:hypothetical protein
MNYQLKDEDIVEIVGETVVECRHRQTVASVADVHFGDTMLVEGDE